MRVTTDLVPWAEAGSGFTRDFEDVVAFLAQRMDKTSITELMGIAWRTVGRIIERVVSRRERGDLLEGLTHISIDCRASRRDSPKSGSGQRSQTGRRRRHPT